MNAIVTAFFKPSPSATIPLDGTAVFLVDCAEDADPVVELNKVFDIRASAEYSVEKVTAICFQIGGDIKGIHRK